VSNTEISNAAPAESAAPAFNILDAFPARARKTLVAEAAPTMVGQPEVTTAPQGGEEHDARTVDYRALKEERVKRKELESQYSSLKEETTRLQQQVNQLLGHVLPPRQEQAPVNNGPDPVEQPLEYLNARLDEALGELTKMKETQAKKELMGRFERDSFEFTKQNPDWVAASDHLVEVAKNQLRTLDIPDDQLDMALAREIDTLITNAYKAGKNPAELVYRLAQTTGFKSAAKAPQGDGVGLQQRLEQGKSIPGNRLASASGQVMQHTPDITTLPPQKFKEEFSRQLKHDRSVDGEVPPTFDVLDLFRRK